NSDSFEIVTGGMITGRIDGGGGSDVLVEAAGARLVMIDGLDRGRTYTSGRLNGVELVDTEGGFEFNSIESMRFDGNTINTAILLSDETSTLSNGVVAENSRRVTLQDLSSAGGVWNFSQPD